MAERPQKAVALDTEPIVQRLSMRGVKEETWYAGYFGEIYTRTQPPKKIVLVEPAEEHDAVNRQVFIANAPTDIRALLGEVERQKAYIEQLETYIETLESS